ncbi:MAG: 4-hydroxythreonine-4-phosphate dehydrogenase PdxA [Proteobacteria bacterium]|nr:4-hydroxythreonine-4-phosphate dehydrogenase PdxA [Pseudomonadota bacterium]
MTKPILAVTMGDPAGIGAEIAVKTFSNPEIYQRAQPFIIGSVECLRLAMEQTGTHQKISSLDQVSDLKETGRLIQVIEPLQLDRSKFEQGKVSAECGRAAVQYFETAVKYCLAGDIQGVVTCPINKEAVGAAGYLGDIGHQEILARMTGSSLTATMLMTTGLKVAHLSTHKSLLEAVQYVKKPVLLDKLRLTSECMKRWGYKNPKIAVSALNPHGGEGGMLGREEIEEIAPAVEAALDEGLNVEGPYPADSIFYRATAGEFDVVLALYHDQGHIAIKVHNFEDSVTATMGIPFVRTSVDHGTAFDIAGKNKASPNGLHRALDTAIDMLNGSLGS